MSYSRGRFGVEYDATRRDRGEHHLLRWALFCIAVIAIVSFISARGCVKNIKLPDFIPPPVLPTTPAPEIPPSTDVTSSGGIGETQHPAKPDATKAEPKPAPMPAANANAVRLVELWLADSAGRPALERTLLEKLLAAERAMNPMLALDTIERLRSRPAMADLDEPLARRLGTLNLQCLYSSRPTPWTTSVVARRGDSAYRIAREHGTTLAAILKLNNLPPDSRLTPGTVLRVLEFPRTALVIHRQTKIADLSLNGKFFKRYYASTSAATKTGSFQVTRENGPRTRLKDLAVIFAPADLDEISMLLPPGASIVVTSP